jgi:FkbM family methyltransferase
MSIELVKKHMNPASVLDVGANIGQFYDECKTHFPDAYYFLIEGNSKCENYLKNLGVDYAIALLSDAVKTVCFYTRTHEPLCTGNSIYRENTTFFSDDQTEITRIETKTLDDLFPEKEFDLLKLDVQGSEIDILNGGKKLVSRAKGIILEVSLVEYNFDAPLADVVYTYMASIGFYPRETLKDLLHPINGSLIQKDILFMRQQS